MIKKTYLFANKHPTAWLSFSTWEWDSKIWGFWSWWESWRFILRQLIKNHWQKEWIDIYNKYNQSLLEIKDCWILWDSWSWLNKKVWCIVLYQNIPDNNDNSISFSEQWV